MDEYHRTYLTGFALFGGNEFYDTFSSVIAPILVICLHLAVEVLDYILYTRKYMHITMDSCHLYKIPIKWPKAKLGSQKAIQFRSE